MLALILAGSTTSCVALGVAAGVVVGSAGIAFITRGCYDPIKLQLLDEETSQPVCDAKVTAREQDGATAAFSSCFYAELPVGQWSVEATRAGYQHAQTKVVVTKSQRCEPSQQSVTLYFRSLSVPPTDVPRVMPPPLPPALPSAPALPSPPANGVGGAGSSDVAPDGGAAPEPLPSQPPS